MSKATLIIEPSYKDILEEQNALSYIVSSVNSCSYNDKCLYSIDIEKIKRVNYSNTYKIVLSSKELCKEELKKCIICLLASSNKFSIKELR